MNIEIETKYNYERTKLIEILFNNLPFNNWNIEYVKKCEQECKFLNGYNELLFPEGLSQVTDFFHQHLDNLTLELLAREEQPKKIRDKIALALKIRIKLLSKSSQNKFAQFFLHPENTAQGAKILWRTCDVIWRYAGDNSIDFNYYTKRSLLAGVFYSSVMYYLLDESENFLKTERFITTSIENIIKLFSIKNKIKFFTKDNIPFIRLI